MKKHPIKRGDESRVIMLKYWEELREHVDHAGPVSFVGHRLGAFQLYPKFEKGDGRGYGEVCELMDEAYDKLGLTSVEVDARLLEGGVEKLVCIAHDPLPKIGDGELTEPSVMLWRPTSC